MSTCEAEWGGWGRWEGVLSEGGAGREDEADEEGREGGCCGTAFGRAEKGSQATAGGAGRDFDEL